MTQVATTSEQALPSVTLLVDAMKDPARLGYPPTLPIELALRERPPKEILGEYGIDQAEWDRIRQEPRFIKALEQAVADMKRDGMGFKVKARLQAEELLKTRWNLIHSPNSAVPPAVKADLIKSTMRWAGFDNKGEGQGGPVAGAALQINIDLSSARRA